ncbi:MAG: hypothetical protein NWF08_02770 [Candidatus Bathyarchaeota archaeon]|nr:hypothetical protein [Candidatus Bathyarchaeota archaeon]
MTLKFDEDHIETQLKGRTLQIYWHFLSLGKKSIGVRELQRALNLSSPSVAFHHLEKLRRLGLLQKKITGDYYLVQKVKVGILKQFIGLGKLLLPRYLFYAIFFTTILVSYLIIYDQSLSFHNVVALIFGASSCLILWYETFRILKQIPF